MATNQTNVHKKMDKVLQKLETLEDNDKAIAKQTNYLAQLVQLAKQDSRAQMDNLTQLVVLAKQDSQRQHQESQTMARDMAQILLEVKKSSDETAKRVAELLGESRKH